MSSNNGVLNGAPTAPLNGHSPASLSPAPKEAAMVIRDLSKKYSIAKTKLKHTTLAESIGHRIKHPFERIERNEFWALRDINLTINEGDVVGIIGRNGAGKSTLLKVMSQITEPTQGEIELYGRVGSLLEVGTGFHPELTGRENIFLNGAILGMSKREVSASFDQIVDFAGVEKFLETPVKRYSSGMYVRLAFAVAAHLSTEILIVDEVLAVGDAEFQRKCLGKMKDVAGGGRTVLFVSHNMAAVRTLCQSAVFMHQGTNSPLLGVEEAINRYSDSFDAIEDPAQVVDMHARPGSGEFRFTGVKTTSPSFAPHETKTIEFGLQNFRPLVNRMFVQANIFDADNNVVINCDSRLFERWFDPNQDYIEGALSIRTPWLKPGRYRVELLLGGSGLIDGHDAATFFDVNDVLPYPSTTHTGALKRGLVYADFSYDLG
jgi:lipopolysaccharide transport system ATP-binding protein